MIWKTQAGKTFFVKPNQGTLKAREKGTLHGRGVQTMAHGPARPDPQTDELALPLGSPQLCSTARMLQR